MDLLGGSTAALPIWLDLAEELHDQKAQDVPTYMSDWRCWLLVLALALLHMTIHPSINYTCLLTVGKSQDSGL